MMFSLIVFFFLSQLSNKASLNPSLKTTLMICRRCLRILLIYLWNSFFMSINYWSPLMFWLQKFDDGTITVLEFFKLFNIDFVIHNPRQSVLSARVSSSSFTSKEIWCKTAAKCRDVNLIFVFAAFDRHRSHTDGFIERQTYQLS